MTPTQPGIDPATLAPGTPVEVEYSTDGDRTLTYVHDADCHRAWFGDRVPSAWGGLRIVRVLGDVTPWPEVAPEDVRVGMRVERRHPDGRAVRGEVRFASGHGYFGENGLTLWTAFAARDGWTLHVHPDDAPDPDPDLIEAMARAAYAAGNECWAWGSTTDGAREAYLIEARAALAVVRAHDAKAGDQ